MTGRPVPQPDADSAPFWEALRAGELHVQRCGDCGKAQLYFRAICKHCWSTAVTPERASGAGTVYSYTVIRTAANPVLAAETPYVLALVDLAEGPRVLARLAAGVDTVAIGAPVRAVFHDHGDWTALHFEPEDDA